MADQSSPFDPRAEELIRAYLADVEAGRKPDFEELCKAHSDLAHDLRELKAAIELASRFVPKGLPREALSERLKKMYGAGVEPDVSLDDEPKSDAGPRSKLFERLRAESSRGTRYKLLGEVARGGMGAILKIWDDELRRTLAMKVVLGKGESATGATPDVDPKTLGRFLEEAQITGQLDHPGIVPVHELGIDSTGRVYFTMRLVKGDELRTVFEHVKSGHNGWNQVRALNVLLRVCEALAFAHSKKVIHRDLKPANVMVGKFGEVYVMDWGLARVLGREDKHDVRLKPVGVSTPSMVKTERHDERGAPDSPLVTMDGDIVGTPSYMAPEQARGELDKLGAHSDVYSIGAMLYQLVTGAMPFVPTGARVSQYTILAAVLHGPPQSIESLAPATPGELVAICEKAMARDIAARYPTTLALASDLRAYLEHRVVAAYETGTWAEARKWVARNRLLAATLAAASAILVAGVSGIAAVEAAGRSRAEALSKKNLTLAEDARTSADRSRAEADRANNEAQRALAAEVEANDARRAEARERTHAEASAYRALLAAARAATDAGDYLEAVRNLEQCSADQRGWEWSYSRARAGLLCNRLDVGEGWANALGFAADGSWLATASSGGVSIWDVASGVRAHEISVGGEEFPALAIGRDGNWLAFTRRDSTPELNKFLELWDCKAWTLTSAVAIEAGCDVLSCDSRGNWIACQSPDRVTLVDRRLGAVTRELECRVDNTFEHTSVVAFDDQRDHIAVCGAHGRLSVRACATGNEVVSSDELGVEAGQLIAVQQADAYVGLSRDPRLIVWSASTGAVLARPEMGDGNATFAAAAPDGSVVAIGRRDGRVMLLDTESWTGARVLDGAAPASRGGVSRIAWSADSTRIAVSFWDRSIRVYRAQDAALLLRFEAHVNRAWQLAFSPDGCLLASSSLEPTAALWDLSWPARRREIDVWLPFSGSGALSPDGKFLWGYHHEIGAGRWTLEDGARADAIDGPPANASHRWPSVVLSPSGELAAASDDGALLWVLDAKTLVPIYSQPLEHGRLSVIAFSPGSDYLAAGSDQGSLSVLEARGGAARNTSLQVGESMDSIIWTGPRTFMAAGRTGFAAAFEVVDLFDEQRLELRPHDPDPVLAALQRIGGNPVRCVLDPDGTQIAAVAVSGRGRGVGDVVVSAVRGTDPGLTLEGHSSSIDSIAWTADGHRILTASFDGTVRVWSWPAGEPVATFRIDAGSYPGTLLASADGNTVMVGDVTTTRAFLWSGDTPALRKRLRASELVEREGEVRARRARRDAIELARRVRTGVATVPDLVLPSDAAQWTFTELNRRAWPLVDPDRAEFGREREGLSYASAAVERSQREDCNSLDTLAWAYFAVGLDQEALRASREAQARAPAEREYEFIGYLDRLTKAIARAQEAISRSARN